MIATLRSTCDTRSIVIPARHREAQNIGELMARIRMALRRRPDAGDAGHFRRGALSIDFEKRLVQIESEAVRLSPKEYALLVTLARSGSQVVTHKRLLAAGWANDTADTHYLRVYVGLLRQKIEADPADPQLLLTEPGVGYRLVVADR